MKTHTIRREYVNPEYLPAPRRDAFGFALDAEQVYLVEFALSEFLLDNPTFRHERRDALILGRRPLLPRDEWSRAVNAGERPEPYTGPEVFRVVALYGKRKETAREFDTIQRALRAAVRADVLNLDTARELL